MISGLAKASVAVWSSGMWPGHIQRFDDDTDYGDDDGDDYGDNGDDDPNIQRFSKLPTSFWKFEVLTLFKLL